MKTTEAIHRYFSRPRARQWSPKTRESYAWAFRYLSAEELPTDTQTLELLLGPPVDHLSQTSRHDIWRRWRAFFRWCTRQFETINPIERIDSSGRSVFLLEPPTTPTSLPRILSTSQLHELLAIGCQSQRDRLMVLN